MKCIPMDRTDNSTLKVGDKVKTRGDLGGFNLVIVEIHNEYYATCRGYGKLRHFNMDCLEIVNKRK